METISEASNHLVKDSFPVEGMTCASCAVSLETYLKSKNGVEDAQVNYPNKTLLVYYNTDLVNSEDLQRAAEEIGYLLISGESANELEKVVEEKEKERLHTLRKKLWVAAIFSIPVFVISMFFPDLFQGVQWLLMVLSVPVIFYSGSEFYNKAFLHLKRFQTNMDTLVALSTGTAFLFSVFNTVFPEYLESRGLVPHVYYESAVIIITLILLGRYLEERAKGETTTSIKKLMGLRPETVTAIRNASEVEIPLEELFIGDLVVIKPGNKVPVDGKVKKGESYVDESMITGEPVPVLKSKNSKIFSGTINQNGSLQVLVTELGEDTILGRIIRLVKEAQASKPPVQKLVDRIASIFVPVVIIISLVSFIGWFLYGPDPKVTYSFIVLITVLIIACPCALGLATPTALMVGIGKGAENGILVKNAKSLEAAESTDVVILDKTGTLTEGRPRVVNFKWLSDQEDRAILKSLEMQSEHPISKSIVEFLEGEGNTTEVKEFKNIPGLGVKARINQKTWCAGNRAFMAQNKIKISEKDSRLAEDWQSNSQTVIFIGEGYELKGLVGIMDNIKPTSKQAVKDLNAIGIETIMVTGDNENSAKYVADHTGINSFKAGCLPDEKGLFVKELQESGKVVAMVGDGINDSHALAQADVSIAMGSGTDIAMDTADITLIKSDIGDIVKSLQLSKGTMRILKQNLFWAFIYNLIAIPIAAGILFPFTGTLLNPMIAGAAMAFSSISVVANSLRLKKISFEK